HPRREIACPLDRRAAGDPKRGAKLGRDDHRDRRLAEPWRTGQQQMVGHLAAPASALEHETELLAQPGLTHEVGKLPRPQRALYLALIGVGERRDEPRVVRLAHARPSTRSAARSAAATSTSAGPAPVLPSGARSGSMT